MSVEADGVLYFYGPKECAANPWACFSQWHDSSFVDADGVRYSSAEQYMMAGKARVMGDDATLQLILACDDPSAVRSLGRKVYPWDEALWQAQRSVVVEEANLLKFGQNPRLRAVLLGTDARLAEASPSDRIWGIGLSVRAAAAGDKWRGSNLLGRALEAVRAQLRAYAPMGPCSRLALDVGGVLSITDTDSGVAEALDATTPSDDAVRATADLVRRFGRDHVFVLSKCKHRVRLATVRFLSRPIAEDKNFFDLTGLRPDHVVFCGRRAGGPSVDRFVPLQDRNGPIAAVPDDCGKGAVAKKLGLTHMVDDRAECLRSFYAEGIADPHSIALFHFGSACEDEASSPCFWKNCPHGWPDVLAAFDSRVHGREGVRSPVADDHVTAPPANQKKRPPRRGTTRLQSAPYN